MGARLGSNGFLAERDCVVCFFLSKRMSVYIPRVVVPLGRKETLGEKESAWNGISIRVAKTVNECLLQ